MDGVRVGVWVCVGVLRSMYSPIVMEQPEYTSMYRHMQVVCYQQPCIIIRERGKQGHGSHPLDDEPPAETS